jgi:trehalose/maltose transport system substrate-binding protein
MRTVVFLLLLLMLFPAQGRANEAVTVGLSCGSAGLEETMCREGAKAWADKTGNKVRFYPAPSSSTNRLALYQQLLAGKSQDVDVYQIDVVWPGLLADYLLDFKPFVSEEETAAFFPTIIRNNTVNNRLVALPLFMDAGLLYYRKDLLDRYHHLPPQTWEEMASIASDIQRKERLRTGKPLWGYIFQGRAYEGLTCNVMEWLTAWDAGTVVDNTSGEITIHNDKAVEALRMAKGWMKTISPPAVLQYAEEDSRRLFQQGGAVFLRHWPYAWFSMNEAGSAVKDKVGITYLPTVKGTRHLVGVLGGSQLAVSSSTQHVDEAVSLAKYLTSKEELERRARHASLSPPRPDLYSEGELLTSNPQFRLAKDVFRDAVARPSSITGQRYNQVSYEIWSSAHSVLSGKQTPEQAVATLERRLKKLSRNGAW